MTASSAPFAATTAEDPDQPLDPLSEAALEWLVRLHDGSAGAAEWAAYETWQGGDHERMAAARRAEQLWESIGPALRRPRKTAARMAMLAVAVTGLLLATFGAPVNLPAVWLADLQTGSGEQRRVTLADGSSLLLDAATSVDVDIAGDHRRLTLHRGALHVAVKPDPARPFEVIAADGRARALGTAFDVRRRDREVQVTVTEHAVRVTYADGSSVDVRSGERVQYGPEHGLELPAAVTDMRGATAWQRGRLVFDGKPLGAVVEDMQRYHGGLVLISDARLRDLPVTGVFNSGDSEGLVNAIAATLPVRVLRLPFVIVIRPNDAS